MKFLYAEYNMYHNNIDIYTNAGYFLRIVCGKAEAFPFVSGLLDACLFQCHDYDV